MTVQEAYKRTQEQLKELYDNREASNIADLVIVHVTGMNRTDRLVNGHQPLNHAQANQLTLYLLQLLSHTPLQYVLQEAWFANMPLFVDEHVLIPRPETEELVEWIVTDTGAKAAPVILDIGTGSGCIPIALKKQIPNALLHALDISPGALTVARKNAMQQHTEITFYQSDILNQNNWPAFPQLDIIVSNPPYIKESEKADMHQNVLSFEPHNALFVPDADALLFYRVIGNLAKKYLKPDGWLYFEINEALGNETMQLLSGLGFTGTELKKDLQGKDRMVRARK